MKEWLKFKARFEGLPWAGVSLALGVLLLLGTALPWEKTLTKRSVRAEIETRDTLYRTLSQELGKAKADLAELCLVDCVANPDIMRAAKERLRSSSWRSPPDQYLFVYALDGTNVMHPRTPELEGKLLWDLQDSYGNYPIRELIEAATTKGGGLVDYEWERPSTGMLARKVGYVEYLKAYGWVIGTGAYQDSPEESANGISAASVSRHFGIDVGLILIGCGALLLLRSRLRQRFSSDRLRLSSLAGSSTESILSSVAMTRLRVELVRHQWGADHRGGLALVDVEQRLERITGELRGLARPEPFGRAGDSLAARGGHGG